MSIEEFISRYSASATEEQILFLAHLAAEASVWARDTYEAGTDHVSNPPRLRVFNEFQNRVAGHLRNLLCGTKDRYPDEVLAEMLVEYARDLNCQHLLLKTWQQAMTPTTTAGSR